MIYIVECSDGTYYTGVTKDLEKRIEKHNRGTGSKYTKARRPVELLVSTQKKFSYGEALKKEHHIKKQSRSRKLEMVKKFGSSTHGVGK